MIQIRAEGTWHEIEQIDYFPLLVEPDLDEWTGFLKERPSNPGRDFDLAGLIPLSFSLRRSFLMAMLSVRFFCFAAWFFSNVSFFSALEDQTTSSQLMSASSDRTPLWRPAGAWRLHSLTSFSCF